MKQHPLADNIALDRARDIYLFSVYTGLRFKDAVNLMATNISYDKDGTMWINIIQQKTGEALNIPMLQPAIEIYNKYENSRKMTGYVLPRLCNQKINSYLKTIAELTGIRKNLTHHTARHTFATSITLSNDVPLEVVSKMLGHTSVKSTQIYATIENQYLSKIAKALNAKL